MRVRFVYLFNRAHSLQSGLDSPQGVGLCSQPLIPHQGVEGRLEGWAVAQDVVADAPPGAVPDVLCKEKEGDIGSLLVIERRGSRVMAAGPTLKQTALPGKRVHRTRCSNAAERRYS